MARTFDAQKFIQDRLGGQLKDVEQGGVVVLEQNGEERKFNLPKFLEDQGINTSDVNIQYNTPSTPVDDNAVGFFTGVKMALTRNPRDRQAVLEEDYGPDNVKRVGKEFRIKDKNGVWKKAEDSFLAGLAADSPVIAAGAAGFAKGAAAGTAVAPGIGTVVGGVLGGAASATLARFGQIEAAEALGIRSEADAEEVRKELGREFANSVIWDAVALGAGRVVRPVARGAGKFSKRLFDKFYDKEAISSTLETLMPGTRKVDWSAVLRSTDDAAKVMKDLDDVVKFDQRAAKGLTPLGKADPATEKTIRIVTSSMKGFKRRASKQFEGAMDVLERQGAFRKSPVKIDEAFGKFSRELADAGLLDGKMNFSRRQVGDGAQQILEVFDPKSQRTLGKVYDQLRSVFNERGQNLNFKDARSLMRGVDDILESSGHFNAGELAISNRARLALKGLRRDLRSSMSSALDGATVRVDGQAVNAATFYNEATSRYSNFRNAYDDFAIEVRQGADKKRVFQTVGRMLGENGYQLEETFGRMAKSVGQDGEKVVQRLQQLRAAKNLSPMYAPGSKGLNTVLRQQVGIGSPRETAPLVARRARSLERLEALQSSPVSKQTMSALGSFGKFVNFIQGLGPQEKATLVTNPELYRPLLNSTMGAAPLEEQLTQELLQGVGQ